MLVNFTFERQEQCADGHAGYERFSLVLSPFES